ncbi:MAG: uracil-DNA glycosylase [Candidatus Heimdallarchaeota archaeon]
MKLDKLNKSIRSCKKCELWRIRINAVPGEGPERSNIFILGQNPGKNEDIQGRPFVGVSGKFLEELLASIGLNRKEVFITGAVKCHTPKNRRPTKHEIEACKPYLLEQIKIIKPKIIVLLGSVAAEAIFGDGKINKFRGKLIDKNGILYFSTFHPAAGLRFPKIRKKMEEDFKKLKQIIKMVLGK